MQYLVHANMDFDTDFTQANDHGKYVTPIYSMKTKFWSIKKTYP